MKRAAREVSALENACNAMNEVSMAALRSLVESRKQAGTADMTYESASRQLAQIRGDFAKIAESDEELERATAHLLDIRMVLAHQHGRWNSLRHAFQHLSRLERTHGVVTVLSTYAWYFAVLTRQGLVSEAAKVRRLAEERMNRFIEEGAISRRSAARAMKIAFRDPLVPETGGSDGTS